MRFVTWCFLKTRGLFVGAAVNMAWMFRLCSGKWDLDAEKSPLANDKWVAFW